MFGVSHSREAETPEAKARWFQSLSLEERMDYLCTITDLVLENSRPVLDVRDAPQATGRVQVLTLHTEDLP